MANSTKKNGRKRSRRGFLKTLSLAAGGLALPGSPAAGSETPSNYKEPPPQRAASRLAIEYPRTFTGTQRRLLAFPLGGIGAGSISLGGRGQLLEWWIFNRPDKGNSPQYAFPSVWVQSKNQKPIARVLEARIIPPYEGPSGLGFGNVPGLPRLESCT